MKDVLWAYRKIEGSRSAGVANFYTQHLGNLTLHRSYILSNFLTSSTFNDQTVRERRDSLIVTMAD